MEISITSEIVSQNTISGEMEEPIKDNKIPEIAKKVLRMPNKDKEQTNNHEVIKREKPKLNKLIKIWTE